MSVSHVFSALPVVLSALSALGATSALGQETSLRSCYELGKSVGISRLQTWSRRPERHNGCRLGYDLTNDRHNAKDFKQVQCTGSLEEYASGVQAGETSELRRYTESYPCDPSQGQDQPCFQAGYNHGARRMHDWLLVPENQGGCGPVPSLTNLDVNEAQARKIAVCGPRRAEEFDQGAQKGETNEIYRYRAAHPCADAGPSASGSAQKVYPDVTRGAPGNPASQSTGAHAP